jgi:predicted CopG family antitoxin
MGAFEDIFMARDADKHVRVTEDTWKELNAQKEPGDSFDDVIQRLLEEEAEELEGGEGNGNAKTTTAAD